MRADRHPALERGYTPNELARVLRISPDRIRAMIRSGELGAVDTSRHRCGRPRFVILPHHYREWEQRRRAATPEAPRPTRRKKKTGFVDYYPD
ncbi:MAG: helix-turn-helix domain-containing protein [Gemmataceae bacterium]